MKIGVIGSMQHAEKMIACKDELVKHGHDAFITTLSAPFVGKTDEEKEQIKKLPENSLSQSRQAAGYYAANCCLPGFKPDLNREFSLTSLDR